MSTEKAKLQYNVVSYMNEAPSQWAVFLHGILGKRANWKGFAKRFVERSPQWGVALVDLRMHGDSLGFAGPHTIDAAAQDVVRIFDDLGEVRMVLGHSFGGKVAVSLLEHAQLDQVWSIDAPVGPIPDAAERSGAKTAISTLKRMGRSFGSRQEFMSPLHDAGFSDSMAAWLAMNLVRRGDRFEVQLDFEALEELLQDFATKDLWPLIAQNERTDLHLVLATKQSAYSDEEKQHALDRARHDKKLYVHEIVDASHWVHVDQPDKLLALMLAQQTK